MSDSEKNGKKTVSIGFFGLLTLLFIGLKLTGYIAWSWWWVLGPLWIPFVAILCFVLITFFLAIWSQSKTYSTKRFFR